MTPTPTTRTPTLTTRTPTPTTRNAFTALQRTLEPVGRDEFLTRYFERAPLHVERDEPGRYDDLLSAGDVERLIASPALRHPAFRLVRADARLSVREYTVDLPWRPEPFTGALDVARVHEEIGRGATLVLQGLHLNWQPVAIFCRELEHDLGQPTQANAYATPRDSQGLPVHHDTHDVFVLQVAGAKRWLVYEPALELPLKHQRYRPELGGPGPAVLDVVLLPGDMMYLPRGWLHEAVTSGEDSLHLTIGINTYTWIDALRAALDRVEEDVELRRAVPGDGTGGERLVDRLRARLAAPEVATAKRERLVRSRRPILADLAAQLRALPALDLDTPLERRATVIYDVAEDESRVTLSFEGKSLVFPAQGHGEAPAAADAAGTFALRDLPGRLDAEGRLVLARRLVREGFLRVTEPSRRTGGSDAG